MKKITLVLALIFAMGCNAIAVHEDEMFVLEKIETANDKYYYEFESIKSFNEITIITTRKFVYEVGDTLNIIQRPAKR